MGARCHRLQADARLTNVDLAEKVGLSPSPCLRRVKRLEREGYIEGYRAVLRRDSVGLGFSVFIGVKTDGRANLCAPKFEKAVCTMPEVIACHFARRNNMRNEMALGNVYR
ncbi:MAG: Lrp/AsnC family transcriptional regulator [Bradyrhizobium sp.]|jgi:Lrp/AsnC family leucine-responsive transcriptional regulator